eukprot:14139141-Ditylum_brightwellii.AAC.1
MKVNWDRESRELRFLVFRKPNQGLKYVDRESTHRPTNFKSITSRVFTRLARPTSNIAANGKACIDEVYLKNAEALFMTDLALPTDFPTLQDLWQEDKRQISEPIRSKKSKGDQRL